MVIVAVACVSSVTVVEMTETPCPNSAALLPSSKWVLLPTISTSMFSPILAVAGEHDCMEIVWPRSTVPLPPTAHTCSELSPVIPDRSRVVPLSCSLHEVPSKNSSVPPSPTAQTWLGSSA